MPGNRSPNAAESSKARDAVAWMQVMSDFCDSPAQGPMDDQLLIVKLGCSGMALSLVMSNEYGASNLVFDRVTACIDGSVAEVTFRGGAECAIQPGEVLDSDPVSLGFSSGDELQVRVFPHEGQRTRTMGSYVDGTMSRLAIQGAGASAAGGEPWDHPAYYYGLKAVMARGGGAIYPVCFFGDSLTNQGRYTSPASLGIMHAHPKATCLNCGISGNRLLRAGSGDSKWVKSFGSSGIERFKRDVTFGGRIAPAVIFSMIGVNDLFQAGGTADAEELPSADALIDGMKSLDRDAESIGAVHIVGTLTPFKGSVSHEREAWSRQKEEVRRTVNDYLRSRGNIVDADALVRDEGDVEVLDARCDCGDHLHFSAAGGIVVAREVVKAVGNALPRG